MKKGILIAGLGLGLFVSIFAYREALSILKKVTLGIDAITGFYLGTGVISSRPHVASILLVVILIAITIFYSRESIKKIFNKDKED